MNTKKLFYGLMAFVVLVASAACTQNSADDSAYEVGVDKTTIVNGDKKGVDRTTIVNGDRQSVDRTTIVNGDRQSVDRSTIVNGDAQ